MIETRIPYEPNQVTPPGGTLADLLEERSMTQAELADRMECSQKTIDEVIKGRMPITSEMALQIENIFEIPADYWMRHEAEYQAYLTRQLGVQ
jgi:HTH-type transcriptional regulator / antitoxin HigA